MPTKKKNQKPERLKRQKSQKKDAKQSVRKLKTELEEYIREIALDEERILANLVFDPVIVGRQLKENHFGVADFQGVEANRVLLEAMLDLIDDEITLNLPNLFEKLKHIKHGNKTGIELAGGQQRIKDLFLSPFSVPGVSMLEDVQPLIEKIRDRNIRGDAHKSMVQFSERIMQQDKDAYEVISSCIQDLRTLFLRGSAGYLQGMERHIEDMKEMVEINRAQKKSYLGLNTDFPILMERLNGFQKEFYLITGGVGMGKSTFATQLAWDLASLNPELTVIFFSLDLNRFDVTAKMIAHSSEVPIDYIKNPYVTRVDFEEKRKQGLETVGKMSQRLLLVDESSGRLFLDDLKKFVRRTRLERGGDIAVIIDPIFKIQLRNQQLLKFNEKCNFLSSELKSLSAVEGVTIIATAGLPKAISSRRPVKEDLEEIMGLLYDPYAVFFLYSDYLNNFDTPFLEWEWGKEDSFMIPISEALIAKNKMGSINTRIFFRFYEAFSRFKECAPQEVENYSAMIENLEKFKEQGNGNSQKSSSGRREEF
ncbi:MAG: replicative DNA helicase [Candidatus Rifleibacteriota bacterium]